MAKIHYARVDEFWRKEEKYSYLDEQQHRRQIEWQEIQPDENHNWLHVRLAGEDDQFIVVGNKETRDGVASSAIFANYSRGVETTRDTWVYNYSKDELTVNVARTIDAYNEQVAKWHSNKRPKEKLDGFITYDDKEVKWSRKLKERLRANQKIELKESAIRTALFRPFTLQHLYFEPSLVYLPALFPRTFPLPETEKENRIVGLTSPGSEKPFMVLASNRLADLHLTGGGCSTQCFPFYSYNEDGTKRRENITDWALEQFRSHYKDESITKWEIFHYVYALLHHPLYRERYAANLKRELPRIPFAPDFRVFAEIGKRLAEIHVNYEQQPEYPLERIEKAGAQLDWRVERMKLSKDKRSLIYNDFLTLAGIPPEVFEYRLGNRSALEWIIDQYQVSTDKRSGITNDPNRPDDPQYIVRLIGQVISVSLETTKLIQQLAGESLLVKNPPEDR
jgi:predicted helicase